MALPAANQPISFLQLQNEFGGSKPISLSEYYRSPGVSNSKNVHYGYQGGWAYNSNYSNSGYSKNYRAMVIDVSTKYSATGNFQTRWYYGGAVVSNYLPSATYSHADFWANSGGKAYIISFGSEPQTSLATLNFGGADHGYTRTGAPQYVEAEAYAATGSKASQAGGTLFWYYYASKTQTRSTVQQNSTVPISSTNNATISMSNFASQGN